MRKLILISAFVLTSVSAHAADNRGPILAANEEPKAVEKVETAKPAETAAAAKTDIGTDTRTDPTQTDASAKPPAARTVKKSQERSHVRGYEADEAKARRIAAKYGVYW